jgi:hypothetical protein
VLDRLARAIYEKLESRGTVELKGKAEPVEVLACVAQEAVPTHEAAEAPAQG